MFGIDKDKLIRRAKILSKLGSAIVKAKLLKERKPIFVGLYITNLCNLRCKYCFVNIDDRFNEPSRAGFNKDEVIKIVDELYEMGTRWIFLLGGEPLMHKDIGPIVKHITKKGILLHILTNGTLIKQKIDEIDTADSVCISIDGAEDSTDKMRGQGTFKRALSGVETALSRGMLVRVHAVLNKHSLTEMDALVEMAKEMKITITISPPNYLGKSDDPALALTTEEYKEFYLRYRKLKEKGYPIGNSFYSIDKSLHWPISYHNFITTEQKFAHYKPIPCVIGYTHGCIDAEGTMFNCIQRGCLDGLNIKEVGIKRAWDALPERRADCVSCSSINTIETSAYLNLIPDIMLDGFRFFLGQRK
ncbi:MAG: radical SAM protein [Nitrospirae bacterium]|nr:radical SAM protein [Nitrospirota bacterium]